MKKLMNLDVSNANGFSIEGDGYNYLVIYGSYMNGGFFCITNHGIAGDLGDFSDTFYNAECIGNAVGDIETGKVIALAIKKMEES